MNMNDTLSIDDLNERHFRRLLAPVVFLVILMIVGIPGNLTILLVYGRNYSTSVYKTIVWHLAIADQIFCTVGIPFNIARVVHYYSFSGQWVCTIFVILLYFLVMYSSHLLMLLSVHRFRKIYTPLRSQITVDNVKYFVLACFLIALILSSPQAGLSKYEELDLGNNLTGHTCAISLTNPSVYSIAFSYGFLTLFIVYTIVLVVLYSLIGYKVYRHHNKRIKKDPKEKSVQKAISSKMTKIAFAISVIFAAGYIPVFALQVTRKMINERDLNVSVFSLLRIAERLYVVNHVANPFIYGIFDKQFRQQVKNLTRLRLQKDTGGTEKREESTATTNI